MKNNGIWNVFYYKEDEKGTPFMIFGPEYFWSVKSAEGAARIFVANNVRRSDVRLMPCDKYVHEDMRDKVRALISSEMDEFWTEFDKKSWKIFREGKNLVGVDPSGEIHEEKSLQGLSERLKEMEAGRETISFYVPEKIWKEHKNSTALTLKERALLVG